MQGDYTDIMRALPAIVAVFIIRFLVTRRRRRLNAADYVWLDRIKHVNRKV